MAKKKVTRKVSKAPARKASRSTRSIATPRSSKGFFAKHKNLKWMIPLFVVLLAALFLVHHYRDEASPNEGSWKNDVRSMLHLNGDEMHDAVLTATPTPGQDSTITPYVTVSPTPESTGY